MTYIPNTDTDRQEMMKSIGITSIEELFNDIPSSVKIKGSLKLPGSVPEIDLIKHMQNLSSQNKNLASDYVCFLGAGAYDHFIPSAVSYITGLSEFYTAYTPYQPEISQGILQAMFEYQSLICEITGMDVANASLYDGATAVVEAVHLAKDMTKREKVIVSKVLHPEYRAVLKTYAKAGGLEIIEINYINGKTDINQIRKFTDDKTACVIMPNPNFFGQIEDMSQISEIIHSKGGLFIAVIYPISLGLLKLPGDYGADIVVGEGQSLGIPLSFGGPYLGLFACRQSLMRRVPGRIVGMTTDKSNSQGYVLTLQTREQHIRREKATSNICSNEALCALSASVYLSCLGKDGFREVANICLQKAHYLADRIIKIKGFSLKFSKTFFNEFVISMEDLNDEKKLKITEKLALMESINRELIKQKIIGGLPLGKFYPELADSFLFCVTEKRTKSQLDKLVEVLSNFMEKNTKKRNHQVGLTTRLHKMDTRKK